MKNPIVGSGTFSIKFKTIIIRGYGFYYTYGHSHGRNWENSASRDVGFRIVRNR